MSSLPETPNVMCDEQFREELTEVVASVHPVIASQLGNLVTEDDVADVAQSAWESAWRSRHRFDPTQGTLHAWVVTIARYRAIDRFNEKVQQLRQQRRHEELALAGERAEPMFTLQTADPADVVISSLDAHHEVTSILQVVEDVISNHESMTRGVSLILIFDDDIDLAAKSLGLSKDVLRRARRELIRCAQVVVKAQDAARRQAGPPTLRTLIECLPELHEAGDWTRQLALAVAQAGGMEHVTIKHVVDTTGYSHHTARQYLTDSLHLLQVAATVIHRMHQHDSALD